MDMKRSLKKAQDYLVYQMNVPPCDFDGGLEFNGYHCYSPDFSPRDGLSSVVGAKRGLSHNIGASSGLSGGEHLSIQKVFRAGWSHIRPQAGGTDR